MYAVLGKSRCLALRHCALTAARRYITLCTPGPWEFDESLSPTHAALLETTLAPYVKGPESTKFGDPLAVGSHFIYFAHCVPENELDEDGYDKLQAPEGYFRDTPIRRWYGGSVDFNINTDLRLGKPALCTESVIDTKAAPNGTRVSVTILRQMRNIGDPEPWAVRERRSLFYFARDSALAKQQLDRRSKSQYRSHWEHKITPSRVLLFRYSALCFNSHRIHYDQNYCNKVEHIPDLLVQGPLMVTLMLRWIGYSVLAQGARRIQSFIYRNTAPITVDEEITMRASQITQDSLEVWMEGQSGNVVLTGTVLIA